MIKSTENKNKEWQATAEIIGEKIAEILARQTLTTEDQTPSLKDAAFNIVDFTKAVTVYATAIKATHEFIYDRGFESCYSMDGLSSNDAEKLRALSYLLEKDMRDYMLNTYDQLVAAKKASKED